jgi:molecular chaperone DnaK (HSP70)
MPPRFTVGIDLGTTNSAVAYVDTTAEFAVGDPIKTFLVRQLVAPGVVEGKTLLPSSMYFPAGSEIPEKSTGLPWDAEREHVVGYLARSLGARIPSRLVHSAKSWLCHPDVDRRGPILPWGAPEDVPHLSPVQASAEYLDHIREAWNAHPNRAPEDRLEHQEIYITVPASFDAVARQLTLEAAREAGLTDITLLEEPQAAFYCWIGTHAEKWREGLGPGRVLLVCDIGGGTTDFTLIVLDPTKTKDPKPERVAVGDHLLLGGDNMDLALAHVLEPRLAGKKRLSAFEWSALTHACREAKEELLKRLKLESVAVSILGASSRVVGGTLATKLTREELSSTILDGFFPFCKPDESPAKEGHGLTELGLPYAADAAVTRHMVQFLRDAAPAVEERLGKGALMGGLVRPDIVLFNGGVFRAIALQERLMGVITSWFTAQPGWKPRAIVNTSPDLAVARGAAYYGLVKRGHGVRIVGGAARAYYLGLGDSGLGQVARVMCVLPRGAEEGEDHHVTGRRFQLTLGQAVRFPLYASSIRLKDKLGELMERDARGLVALPALRTVVEPGASQASAVEVQLASRLTETGTLELACESPADGHQWTLELELRGAQREETAAAEVAATGQRSAEALARAQELVKAVFSPVARAASGLPKDPNGLRKRLEEGLEARRELWIPRTLRSLLKTALDVADGRGASPVHEARWLNLAGFGIRPGFGYPEDRQRVDQLWRLFNAGLKHPRDEENHREWWILWRRVAGGLDVQRQETLFGQVAAHLLPDAARRRNVPPEAVRPGVLQEMWRLAATLEWIAPAEKVKLGEVLLSAVSASAAPPYAFWALARIGARVPVSGTVAHVVSAEVVARWIPRLSRFLRAHGEKVSFTLAHLARRTGDRARDVDEGLRKTLLKQMQDLDAPERHRQLVGEVVKLADAERGTLMGDSIPPGLELVGE